ncbi:unnamed protein product, partial [Wuchereria bancrofti]
MEKMTINDNVEIFGSKTQLMKFWRTALNFKYNRSTFVVCSSTAVLLTIVFLSNDVVSIVEGCIPTPPATTTAPRGLFVYLIYLPLYLVVLLPNDNNAESGTNQAASTSNRSWLRRMINTTPFLEKSLSTIRSTGQLDKVSSYQWNDSYYQQQYGANGGYAYKDYHSKNTLSKQGSIECVAPERWIHRNIQQKVFEFTGVSCNQETPTSGSCHQ